MQSRMISIFVAVLAAALLLVGTAGIAQADVIAHWKLDETSGNVIDSTGKGHTGLASAPSRGQIGKIGYAYSFNGDDDYIQVADADDLDGMQKLTIVSWFNLPSLPEADMCMVWKREGTNNRAYYVQLGDGGTVFYGAVFYGSSSTARYCSFNISGNVNPNTWYQLTYTFDGAAGVMKLYLDGLEKGSFSFTAGQTIKSTTSDLFISSHGGTGTFCWGGLLDDIGILNEALSTGKVKSLSTTLAVEGLEGYDLSKMYQLFQLYDNTNPNATEMIGTLTWRKVTGLSIGEGMAQKTGGYHYVQFDASGNGVSTIPEPGTLALLGCGLLGLICYAWRRRK